MSDTANRQVARRTFLMGAGLGAAAVAAGALPTSPRLSPNERVNVAGIGVGSQGGGDVDAIVGEGANLVALCDVDDNYAGRKFAQYPDAKKFKDYRVMLDKMGSDIDGVVIGTPDHTHAVIAMEAMRRGKHVYCEKPLAHTVHEVRTLMAAARKYGVVTQLGNQGHSSDSIRRVCEWIWAGAIGKVHTIHAACGEFKDVYCQKRNLGRLAETFEVPSSLDYDLWLGPVAYRPYTPFWVHWNWRGWMPFGTGTIGDWICHVLDPSFWALDLGAPVSVRAEVTDYEPKVDGLTYPPATRITFKFAAKGERGPVELVWFDGNNPIPTPAGLPDDDQVPRTGAVIMGDKGMIVHGSHGGGGCHLQPDSVREAFTGANAPAQKLARIKGHHWDWVDAIRNGRQAGSKFEYGGRLTQIALIGAVAVRYPNETLEWDDRAGCFKNHRLANATLEPRYRKGWKL